VPELANTIMRDLPRLRDTEAISRDSLIHHDPLEKGWRIFQPKRYYSPLVQTIQTPESSVAAIFFGNSNLMVPHSQIKGSENCGVR
jgi:hypothetical protein